MNQLNLGITIALRDAFSFRAKSLEHSFRSLDDTAFRASRGIRRSIGNVELGFANVTRTLAASAAVLGSLVYPTREAMAFNKALSETATIADHASTNMASLRDTIIDQAITLPTKSLVDQTEAVYEAVSSGFLKTRDAAYIAGEATKTAVATLSDTQTTLRGLTGLMNAYNLSASEAGHVSDLMFQTVQFGVVRMSELAHNIGMVSAAAAASGDSIENMMALYAGLTLGGLSPEQSGQYGRQLYLSIVKPTRAAMLEAKKYGITLSKELITGNAHGLTGALLDLANKSHAIGKDGKIADPQSFFRMLSGRQAATGAAVLIQKRAYIMDMLKSFNKDEVFDEFGVKMSNREYALQIRSKELDYQLAQLRSTFHALNAVLGQAVTGVLAPLTRAFNALFTPVVRLAKNFPIIGKMLAAQIFASGIALVIWAGLQAKAITQSFAFLRVLVRFRREMVSVFGFRIPLTQLSTVLSGVVLAFVLGFAAIHHAYERNIGGLADKVKGFVMMWRGVTQLMTSQDGVWGTMSADLARQLQESGLWRAFTQVYMWVTRFKYLARGIVEGVGHVFASVRDTAINMLMFVGRLFTPLQGIARSLFFTKISGSSLTSWRMLGDRIGHILGIILLIVAAQKYWLSMVVIARVAAWTITAPFKYLLSIPGRLAKGFSNAWGSIKSGARLVSALIQRLMFWRKGPKGAGLPGFSASASASAAGARTASGAMNCPGFCKMMSRMSTNISAIRGILERHFGAYKFQKGGSGGGMGGPGGGMGGTKAGAMARMRSFFGFHASAPGTAAARPGAYSSGTALVRYDPGYAAYQGASRSRRMAFLRQFFTGGGEGPSSSWWGRGITNRLGRGRTFYGRAASFGGRVLGNKWGGRLAGLLGGWTGNGTHFAGPIRFGGRLLGRTGGAAARLGGNLLMSGADNATGGLASMVAPHIMSGLSKVVGWVGKLGGLMGILGRVAGVVFGPWGLAIAGIALGVYLLYKHWDKVKEVIGNIWQKMKGFFNFLAEKFPMFKWLGNLFGGVMTLIKSAFEHVKNGLKWVFDKIRPLLVMAGFVGEDPWKELREGAYVSDLIQNGQVRNIDNGRQLLQRKEGLLEKYLGEWQSGDIQKDTDAKALYTNLIQDFLGQRAFLGKSFESLADFNVSSQGLADVIKQVTGTTVGVEDVSGAGNNLPLAGDDNSALDDNTAAVEGNTDAQTQLWKALRKGANKPWDGQMWPEATEDPYARYDERMLARAAKNYGQGGVGKAGQLGEETFAQGTANLGELAGELRSAVAGLKNMKIEAADIHLGGRAVGKFVARVVHGDKQTAQERSPNISTTPGIYPAGAQ